MTLYIHSLKKGKGPYISIEQRLGVHAILGVEQNGAGCWVFEIAIGYFVVEWCTDSGGMWVISRVMVTSFVGWIVCCYAMVGSGP